MNSNQEKVCFTVFNQMKLQLPMWRDDRYANRYVERTFYNGVSIIQSKLFSKNARFNPKKLKVVNEHCFTPQLIGRFIFDNHQIYLNDYDKFREIYIIASTTIKTLDTENILLRQQNNIPILEKYKTAKIDLWGPTGFIKYDSPFPLSLPNEIIEYDKQIIKENLTNYKKPDIMENDV